MRGYFTVGVRLGVAPRPKYLPGRLEAVGVAAGEGHHAATAPPLAGDAVHGVGGEVAVGLAQPAGVDAPEHPAGLGVQGVEEARAAAHEVHHAVEVAHTAAGARPLGAPDGGPRVGVQAVGVGVLAVGQQHAVLDDEAREEEVLLEVPTPELVARHHVVAHDAVARRGVNPLVVYDGGILHPRIPVGLHQLLALVNPLLRIGVVQAEHHAKFPFGKRFTVRDKQ